MNVSVCTQTHSDVIPAKRLILNSRIHTIIKASPPRLFRIVLWDCFFDFLKKIIIIETWYELFYKNSFKKKKYFKIPIFKINK